MSAGQVIVVVVRDSALLNSDRESQSVDHASESGSSQAGDKSAGPRGMEASLFQMGMVPAKYISVLVVSFFLKQTQGRCSSTA